MHGLLESFVEHLRAANEKLGGIDPELMERGVAMPSCFRSFKLLQDQRYVEAVIGKHYMPTIVVTNSPYTAAAEQLAPTNGILLLHYSDLFNLQGLLQTASPSHSRYSVA